ncbi:DDE_3 domain-containing protein [Trichonephila clavipes]|nr:DDE_3 domain-containing protein [Trichonephila clavipes]
MITVKRHLHKQNIYGRASIPKPLATGVKTKRRLQWTDARLEDPCSNVWSRLSPSNCPTGRWIRQDKGSRVVVFCWTNCNPEREVHWGKKYREILADQVHPMMQTLFPAGNGIFQDDNVPIHAAELVQSWFDEQ